jgi:hypothetical protein
MAQRQFRSDDSDLWLDRFGDGSTGALSQNTATDAIANTTFSGTQAATSGTAGSGTGFAAGDLILIHQSRNGGDGAGVWELNKISSVGGGTDWTLSYALQNDYGTTGQVYLLKQYSTVTINSGQTFTGRAWDGTSGGIVAFLANSSITVTGGIDVSGANGKGYRGYDDNNGAVHGLRGEGTASAGNDSSTSANGNGGGSGTGGSGVQGGGGGGGGHAASGSNGSTAGGTGGTGGTSGGVAGLTTMIFGGGGGTGGRDSSNPGRTRGGSGGGIVILIAPTITVTGSITANGQNAPGTIPASGSQDGGGGGGAGGSILLKGQALTLGSSLITAAAGSLAGGANGGASGGNGSVGRIHADYSTSISGTTSPTIDSTLDTTLEDATGGGSFLLNFI